MPVWLAGEPLKNGCDMRLAEWQKGALIASIAWAISGFYCGMHYPVAPALRTYEHCLSAASSTVNGCRSQFIAEWNRTLRLVACSPCSPR
jgi:hypothetical protein